MPTKKSAKTTTETAKSKAKKSAKSSQADAVPGAMPKGGKDPQGGLTAKGREYFAAKEGAHLRPGVQGPADTPEKMVRKGSFLRRHFANPRGPMKDEKGEPTRLALSAHAWGEEVPQNMADAKHLAEEGHELLEQYHEIKDGKGASVTAAKRGGVKVSSRAKVGAAVAKTAWKGVGGAKRARGTKAAAKKLSPKDTTKPAEAKTPAKKRAKRT